MCDYNRSDKIRLNPVFTSTITIYINAVIFVIFFEKFFVFQQTSKFSEIRNSEILNGGGGGGFLLSGGEF